MKAQDRLLVQFLTSRAGSPAPFRPQRSNTLTDEDLQALEQLGSSNAAAITASKLTTNDSAKPKVDLDALTAQANSQ